MEQMQQVQNKILSFLASSKATTKDAALPSKLIEDSIASKPIRGHITYPALYQLYQEGKIMMISKKNGVDPRWFLNTKSSQPTSFIKESKTEVRPNKQKRHVHF